MNLSKIVVLSILSIIFLKVSDTNAQSFTTFTHDGQTRTYTYYTPTNWTSEQSVPLLMVLHGLTQTGLGVMNITKFNEIAESEGFIAVYPDGLENAWNADMNVTVSSADDKGFLERLVQHFLNNFNVDESRVYFTGFSNGGFMSHKMACESELCIAGIATVSGNMSSTVYENCNPLRPTSVLHIHGTADAVVSYFGSPTTGVSVDASMEKWRNYLGCSSNPITENMPNPDLLDLSSPTLYKYVNCVGNHELQLVRITGGGHQWPGINTLVGGVGTINMDFYSPEFIWNFLKNKTCSKLNTVEIETFQTNIYPNPSNGNFVLETNFTGEWKILNQIGQEVKRFSTDSGENEIRFTELNCGFYWIISENRKLLPQKLLIVK